MHFLIIHLKKNEPNPTLKMSIRLLRHIFSSATDVAEFQRQLSAPNVPKFSLALITVAEKQDNEELKVNLTLSVHLDHPYTLSVASSDYHTLAPCPSLSNTTSGSAWILVFLYLEVPQRVRSKPYFQKSSGGCIAAIFYNASYRRQSWRVKPLAPVTRRDVVILMGCFPQS